MINWSCKGKITTFFIPKIIVEDSVENIGSSKSPIMILYHVNIGYPVLDKTSKSYLNQMQRLHQEMRKLRRDWINLMYFLGLNKFI